MNWALINTAILATAFLGVFGTAEIGYHYLKMQAEHTRKFVHIASGLLTLLFPLFIGNQWYVLFLCMSFALILLVSLTTGLLPSINAVGRKTYGSLIYPAAVFGCYIMYYNEGSLIYFYLPILILALCDPLAAIAGKKWGTSTYSFKGETKSVQGSMAFFLAAVFISIILFKYMTDTGPKKILEYSLITGMAATVAEGVSPKGLDNITIPGIILIVMKLVLLV